jgi:hypothetical protein
VFVRRSPTQDSSGTEHIGVILRRLYSGNATGFTELPKPPYDSPLEEIFSEHCFKHLAPSVSVNKQVEVKSTHGLFRLDFLLSVADRRIAVECDGKDFHDGLKDELRDAIILGEGCCNTIYHFRGRDLVYYPHDCVWLMSILDRDLFSERGHIHLDHLRSLVIGLTPDAVEKNETFMFNIDPPSRYLHVFRRSAILAARNPSLNYFWKSLYEFACEHPGVGLDELIEIETESWRKEIT